MFPYYGSHANYVALQWVYGDTSTRIVYMCKPACKPTTVMAFTLPKLKPITVFAVAWPKLKPITLMAAKSLVQPKPWLRSHPLNSRNKENYSEMQILELRLCWMNPLRRSRVSSGALNVCGEMRIPTFRLRGSCVSSGQTRDEMQIPRYRGEPSAEIARVECSVT